MYQVTVELNSDSLIINGKDIKVGIKSKPVKGKANKEIITKLAKHFGVSTSNVTIKRGHKSTTKIIEVQK